MQKGNNVMQKIIEWIRIAIRRITYKENVYA